MIGHKGQVQLQSASHVHRSNTSPGKFISLTFPTDVGHTVISIHFQGRAL